MLDLGIDQSFHSCILSIHAVIPEAMGSILVGGLSYKDQSFHQELHYQLVEAQYSLLLENLSPRFVDGDHLRFPPDAEFFFEEIDFEETFWHLVFCSSPESPELPSTGGITLPIQDE